MKTIITLTKYGNVRHLTVNGIKLTALDLPIGFSSWIKEHTGALRSPEALRREVKEYVTYRLAYKAGYTATNKAWSRLYNKLYNICFDSYEL